jgi:RNA polymerase sigma-70 factor (ECF subfamily)
MDAADDLMTDAERVARTLAGDREAFGRLYDRYARLVRAVAFGAGRDPAAVQDVTQESFLRAFRQLPTLRAPDRFGPWVVSIARQVVREHRRRRRLEPLDAPHEPAATGSQAAVDDADEIAHVLKLLGRLAEQERLAVQLFFLSDRDANETARLLDISRSGTYALLKRACTRLARWLGVRQPEKEVRP